MARTKSAARSWLRTNAPGAVIALAGLWLFAAMLAPALAENACPADLGKTCPVDYAAKTCDDKRPSFDAPRPPDLVSITERKNIAESKGELSDYKCTGDYDKDVATVLDQAIDYVEHYDTAPKETEAEKKGLALVLDIDETALSNWPAILTDDYGFIRKGPCDLAIEGACGFEAWQIHAQDTAIAPTLKLFNVAKEKHIKVFFITGRCDIPHMREATMANLNAAGYVDLKDDQLILRSKASCAIKLDTVVDFKAPERAKIEKDYEIIANVGDQWSDLNGGFSEKNFKVPNPFYFIK